MLCAYDAANRLASSQRTLSLFNEHISHSEYLSKHREEREKFGCAVGRVLAEVQKSSRDQLPFPEARPDMNPLAKRFLSSRMHSNLERCIGGLAKNLPHSAEGLTLALYYIDRLQHLYTDVVTGWTLDRMFATAVVVASKFAFDEVYPNTYYASRLGLSLLELNNLEIAFLSLFGFNMVPDRPKWIKLHCAVARIAFEPARDSSALRSSCPSMEIPLSCLSKGSSCCSNNNLSATDTPMSPSPVTPMITAVDSETPREKTSSLRNHGIAITISSITSPESSSVSPKPVAEVAKSHGKRHSHCDLEEKPHKHHHRRRHRRKPSDTD